jgi:hypothetical protein
MSGMIDVPVRQPPPPRPPNEADMAAFDAWLRKDLAKRFGAVKDEPIPEDMLLLLKPN